MRLGRVLGPSWAPLGPLLGPLGALLGPSWGPLGAILGPTWAQLGPSWAQLVLSWGRECLLEAMLGRIGTAPTSRQNQQKPEGKSMFLSVCGRLVCLWVKLLKDLRGYLGVVLGMLGVMLGILSSRPKL